MLFYFKMVNNIPDIISSCHICGGKDFHIVYKNVINYKSILRCKKCGVWVKYPILSKEAIREIYGENYYNSWEYSKENLELLRAIKRPLYISILKEIKPSSKPFRLLDVGCAMGISLEVAAEIGLKPYGIEISEFAGKIAKEKFGDAVTISDIKDTDLLDDNFDAITMVDFFEHISDPVLILKKICKSLKDQSLLVIVTPNSSSISSKIMRGGWPHIKEEHVYYYSPAAIEHVLHKCGFEIIKIKSFLKPITLSYARSVLRQSRYNIAYIFFNIVHSIVTKRFKTHNFRIPMGEMLVIARKNRYV